MDMTYIVQNYMDVIQCELRKKTNTPKYNKSIETWAQKCFVTPGGGDLEIFIRHRATKDMVCLILMS